MAEAKPMYSLKPKKKLKLDLNKYIDPTMVGNLIWICETQKATCILLAGKMQKSKLSTLLCLHPMEQLPC
jgi:hypothetical protein